MNDCLKTSKVGRYFFVSLVFLFGAFNYFVYVTQTVGKKIGYGLEGIILLAIFHVFFILTAWAYVKSWLTDPGRVPLYWGFFLDDSEQKRKRYCLVCHIFKPERCHHCSVCDRCVLNMDHHCPWVNNCIGFYNRKFFIQLLFYILCTLIVTLTSSAYTIYSIIRGLFSDKFQHVATEDVLINISFIFSSILFVLLIPFFKYHVSLVLHNTTTIEDLDKQRHHKPGENPTTPPPSATENNEFDLGSGYNWITVFGNKRLYWFLPWFTDASKPIGDGVQWQKKTAGKEIQLDEFNPNRTTFARNFGASARPADNSNTL